MHTPSRRRFVGAALSAVIASATLLLPIGHAQAADPAHTHLVLGATAGYNYDVLKKAVVPQLEKDGYTVKLIEFNATTTSSPIWRWLKARSTPTCSSTSPT